MHTPDPESLRCFVAAAHHLNFRAAANSVHLSPAAFGQRIAKLEEQLEVRLFERTTRQVRLTPAGQRILPVASSLLSDMSLLMASAKDADQAAPFELVLATRFELGLSWLVPSLSSLSRSRPERTIHLSFGDSTDMLTRIENGVADASVTSSRTLPDSARFAPLHPEEYALVANSETDLPATPVAPDWIGDQRILDLSPDLPLLRYFLDAHGAAAPSSRSSVECLGTIAAVLMRVREGAGIAVLPRYFLRAEATQGKVVEVPTEQELRTDAFRLVWHEGHPFETELECLAEELRAIPLT